MAHVAYIRVSSTDQNNARQLDGCGVQFDKVFTDQASGGSTDRPALAALRGYCRGGDTVHCHSIDRLARNLADLLGLISDWRRRGISVRFHREGLSFGVDQANAIDELLLSMLGAVAAFERSMIRERQAEGIAKAKQRKVYKGRQPIPQDKREAIVRDLQAGKSIRVTASGQRVGVSTVQRIKKGAAA